MRIHEPVMVRSQDTKFTRQEIATITDEIMYTLASMLPGEYRGVYSEVESFAPSYLLPYHAPQPRTAPVKKEVMSLTN
jgi:hypothetical protein